MRLRSVLLRLLLSLALVANGSAVVHASARMAFAADAGIAMDHKAEPACHDVAGMQDGTTVDDHDAPPPPAPHDDCCPPGACHCSCVSHAPTILAVHAMARTARPAAAPPSARRLPHATPALPRLIRPPIG